jgi:hypothetical protein
MKATSPLRTYVLSLVPIAALVGCGGGLAANGPPGSGPSQLSAKLGKSSRTLKVVGPAFSAIVTREKSAFADKTTRLTVWVFAANTDPAPTCEMLTDVVAIGGMTRGGFVSFTLDKIAEGPGNLGVAEMGAMLSDSEGITMGGGMTTNMSMTLRSYDGKTFAGDITTAAGAENTASGSIAGKVCPPRTVTDPNAGASYGDPSSSGGSVVDPSAETSTGSSTATPAEPPPEPPPPPPPPGAKTKPKTKPKPKGKPTPAK